LPFVIVGAVVAILVVGGFAWMQHQQQGQTGEPTHVANDDPEQLALQAAKKDCDEGKCDLAHDRLAAKIDSKSSLRQSSDYQNIETRWADWMLAQADKETDVAKKRRILRDVQGTETVPQTRRNIAAAKLAELDAATSATTTATTPIPSASHTTAPTSTAVTTTTTTATQTAPTATHTARPTGGGSVFSQASALATNGDTAGARALLEPRVFGSGKATPEEINLLKGICKSQHDKSCTAAIATKYPQ